MTTNWRAGQKAKIDSGMGGSFTVKILEVNEDGSCRVRVLDKGWTKLAFTAAAERLRAEK